MAVPVGHPPVRLNPVDECTAGVLEGKTYRGRSVRTHNAESTRTIAMIMIHLREHVHRIGVERKVVRIVKHAECVKLMTQRSFPEHKLCSVCSVKAVHTVRPAYAILQGDGRAIGYTGDVRTTQFLATRAENSKNSRRVVM